MSSESTCSEILSFARYCSASSPDSLIIGIIYIGQYTQIPGINKEWIFAVDTGKIRYKVCLILIDIPMQMRQLMAIGCRIICDIHICITVCFHRKREIIPRHITLAHQPGKHHMLDIRIVAGQPWIPAGQFPKSISRLFLHISIICYVSVFIPLYFSAVFVTLLFTI